MKDINACIEKCRNVTMSRNAGGGSSRSATGSSFDVAPVWDTDDAHCKLCGAELRSLNASITAASAASWCAKSAHRTDGI